MQIDRLWDKHILHTHTFFAVNADAHAHVPFVHNVTQRLILEHNVTHCATCRRTSKLLARRSTPPACRKEDHERGESHDSEIHERTDTNANCANCTLFLVSDLSGLSQKGEVLEYEFWHPAQTRCEFVVECLSAQSRRVYSSLSQVY